MKLSPWTVVDDVCAMRYVEGTDPNNIANRVAFIEKTPRVRVASFTNNREDYKNWKQGYKNSAYGFSTESRKWCDDMLLEMGYEL